MTVQAALPDIDIGANYAHTFAWSTVDSNGVYTPKDLTGYSARLQIKRRVYGDLVDVADWKTSDMVGGGQITIDANKFVLVVAAAVTALLPQGDYEYGLLAWPTATPGNADLVAKGSVSALKMAVSLP